MKGYRLAQLIEAEIAALLEEYPIKENTEQWAIFCKHVKDGVEQVHTRVLDILLERGLDKIGA